MVLHVSALSSFFCQLMFNCTYVASFVYFVYSPVDGLLGFHSLVILNNGTVSVSVPVFVWKILSCILTFVGKEPNQDLLTFELSNTPQKCGLCGNSHLKLTIVLK